MTCKCTGFTGIKKCCHACQTFPERHMRMYDWGGSGTHNPVLEAVPGIGAVEEEDSRDYMAMTVLWTGHIFSTMRASCRPCTCQSCTGHTFCHYLHEYLALAKDYQNISKGAGPIHLHYSRRWVGNNIGCVTSSAALYQHPAFKIEQGDIFPLHALQAYRELSAWLKPRRLKVCTGSPAVCFASDSIRKDLQAAQSLCYCTEAAPAPAPARLQYCGFLTLHLPAVAAGLAAACCCFLDLNLVQAAAADLVAAALSFAWPLFAAT
eukprot:663036-Pelagomonas_calceolata.AAC.7